MAFAMIRRRVVRALDRPGDDRRGGVAHEAEADEPAEADREPERDDDRDRGDQVAEGVQGEQEAAEGRVDVGGAEGQADDRDPDDHVERAQAAAGVMAARYLWWMDGVWFAGFIGVGSHRRAADRVPGRRLRSTIAAGR